MSDSADPQTVDANALQSGESKSIDAGVKALWESARRAAETVSRLREENRELQGAVERVEKELHAARIETAQARRQVTAQETAAGASMPGAERDVLTAKVKDLIARLDAYL